MKIRLLIAWVLLFAFPAVADVYDLNDYLEFVEYQFNNSQSLSELAARFPGRLDQKSSFIRHLRNKKIDQLKPLPAKKIGLTLEFQSDATLVLDFSELALLKISVNGEKVDLKKSRDLMGDFNRSYSRKFSWLQYLSSRVFAQNQKEGGPEFRPLSELEPNFVKPLRQHIDGALSKTIDAASVAFIISIGTYLRCEEGDQDCPFLSHADNLIRKLTVGDHRGLKEFSCENGRLKIIQANSSLKDKKIPQYELSYKQEDVVIKVKNFGPSTSKKASCEYVYNERTKLVQSKRDVDACKLPGDKSLNSLGGSTPLASAYRCCQISECELKVQKFKNSQAIETEKNESPQDNSSGRR